MSNATAIKPPPKPGQVSTLSVKVFKALYDYKSQRPDELSFNEGDIIYIIDMISDKSWWLAKCGNVTGLVPYNYIEENTESIVNPIHEAAKRGNSEFLKECLDNKVSVNSLDKAGNTALHWAAYGGHVDCVKLLLNNPNILLDIQNKLGDTPIHNAAVKNRIEVIEFLKEKGVRFDILNSDLKSPYDLALDAKCKALLEYNVDYHSRMNKDYFNDEDGNDSDD